MKKLHDAKADFNSIKVQLKLLTHAIVLKLKVFQFHKGTIKTTPEGHLYTCFNCTFMELKLQGI